MIATSWNPRFLIGSQCIFFLSKSYPNCFFASAAIAQDQKPQITKEITTGQVADVEKLLEKIEEDDDVMNVYHTMQESAE